MTTIHYHGTLSVVTQRDALMRDLSACAKSMDSGSIDVKDDEAGLTGIILQPANRLEPIPFLFDAEGRLHALGDLLMPGGKPIYFVAVKTHYAGTDAHQWFTRLLRHIKDTFMPGLTVTDESDYWEHQDEEKLKAYFARLDRLSNALADHLRNDVACSRDGGADDLIACITQAAEMSRRQESS